jgi:hypothetical protein
VIPEQGRGQIGDHRIMDPGLARRMWHYLEAINAVAYFSPECREAPARQGLKGFWMGYFACRAAPMGRVGAAIVEATFFNFHPARVRRAIPDAWGYASPKQILDARSAAAAAALRRLLSDRNAEHLAADVLSALDVAVDSAVAAGRPLFGANRDVARGDDPVAQLWQAATTLREHRGDGHVALLTGAGLDGCEAHMLFSVCEGVTPELFLESRGWSHEDWGAAVDRLKLRGCITPDGHPAQAGASFGRPSSNAPTSSRVCRTRPSETSGPRRWQRSSGPLPGGSHPRVRSRSPTPWDCHGQTVLVDLPPAGHQRSRHSVDGGLPVRGWHQEFTDPSWAFGDT